MPKRPTHPLEPTMDSPSSQTTTAQVEGENHGLRLSHYTIVPLLPGVDDTPAREITVPDQDVPEGYDVFVKTFEAMEERYPLQTAVLQLETLIRVLQLICTQERLDQLDEEDFALMLCLLDGLEEVTKRCHEECPREQEKGPGQEQETDTSTQ